MRRIKAPVRPRIILPETGETCALEEAVGDFLESTHRGSLEIRGVRGAGKTTALQHLAAILSPAERVVLLDEPEADEVVQLAENRLVIYTSSQSRSQLSNISLVLASWSNDDLIEYLLATHHVACRSVMQRVRSDSYRHRITGQPILWRMILEEMSADEEVNVRGALGRAVDRMLVGRRLRRLAGKFCLAQLTGDHKLADRCQQRLLRNWQGDERFCALLQRPVQLLCAARFVLESRSTTLLRHLSPNTTPNDLLGEIAHDVAQDPDVLDRFRTYLGIEFDQLNWLAASVLHAANVTWQPTPKLVLNHAQLNGIVWPEQTLRFINLSHARLKAADLSNADLVGGGFSHCKMEQASLQGANIRHGHFDDADLAGVDLREAMAATTDFERASLRHAVLERGVFESAHFVDADLTGASLRAAVLSGADFTGARIVGADFRDCDLTRARLDRLVLRKSLLTGASFKRACLERCDLEFVELPMADFAEADLEGAWLTGSVMPAAVFRNARLAGAGLADVEWEGADLRGADLRACQFHLGSSRSGRVDSPYPSHGSRTGFYTDAYDDRFHKTPEEIRKANLCGADLRGALVGNADFYLVDLRGAKYDRRQEQHFRRCDAILDEPAVE